MLSGLAKLYSFNSRPRDRIIPPRQCGLEELIQADILFSLRPLSHSLLSLRPAVLLVLFALQEATAFFTGLTQMSFFSYNRKNPNRANMTASPTMKNKTFAHVDLGTKMMTAERAHVIIAVTKTENAVLVLALLTALPPRHEAPNREVQATLVNTQFACRLGDGLLDVPRLYSSSSTEALDMPVDCNGWNARKP